MKLAVALLLTCMACRISTNKWGGAPPRASNAVKIVLHGDKDGTALAKRILAADPRVTVTELPDERPIEDACGWARANGADYYATATFGSAYAKHTECTHYSSNLLDVKHEECTASRVTSEGASSAFALRVYDASDCEFLPSLSEQIGHYANGNETESPVEAAMAVTQMAPQKYAGFPDQSMIAADGRVENAAGDGQYALFRQRTFQGIASLHGDHLRMLMCCEEPEPGDIVLKRGPMHFIETLLSFDAGIVERQGAHLAALGAGIHIRRSPLAAGLQLGISAETLRGEGKAGAGLISGEVGWGLQVAPAWHISANADLGFAYLTDNASKTGAPELLAYPNVRALFGIKWFYAGVDLGYAISPSTDMGVRMRGPLARLTAAIFL